MGRWSIILVNLLLAAGLAANLYALHRRLAPPEIRPREILAPLPPPLQRPSVKVATPWRDLFGIAPPARRKAAHKPPPRKPRGITTRNQLATRAGLLRVRGIFRDQECAWAVISLTPSRGKNKKRSPGKLRRVKAGDALAGGRVLAIEPEWLLLKNDDGRQYRLRIFSRPNNKRQKKNRKPQKKT